MGWPLSGLRKATFLTRDVFSRRFRHYSIESLETRVLLSSISAKLWNDANANGILDVGESGVSGWIVYLDQNRNRVRDTGEKFTTTSASGSYSFTNLAAGTYFVGQEVPAGWSQTYPTLGGVTSGSAGTSGAAQLPATGQNAIPLTYTGSNVQLKMLDVSASASSSNLADAESAALIHMDQFRTDPRFAGIDGRGFSIAVLDTGIDVDHPFFGPDVDHNGIDDRIVYQHDFINNDNDASDGHSHGSNVTSIAAGGDGTTYAGMSPGANIIALKVLNDFGSGTFAALEQALQWCVANASLYNIASINMSLGDGGNYATAVQQYGIGDELAALANAGVIVCSADGNSYYSYQSQGVAYPAADPNSLAIGAVWDSNVGAVNWGGPQDFTTAPDRITSFSQRSTTQTDIFAPGAYITGANWNGGTISYAGTSQATPHIAGIAAWAQQLAMQQLGRRLTVTEFRDLLRSTGATIVDGDDENDNVANTGATFQRVDAEALATAIYNLGNAYPYGYRLTLTASQTYTTANFGNHSILQPGKPDLDPARDTGISNSDDITSYDNSTLIKRLVIAVPGTLPGASVTLYADGSNIGTTTAPAGNVTLMGTNGTFALSNGTHTITARQTINGQTSLDSPPLSITIDSIVPGLPGAFALQSASDTGISSADGVTSNTRPKFNVTVTSAPYFRVTRDGATVVADFASVSVFQSDLLADGTHSFLLQAEDAAGNLSNSLLASLTIDTVPWQPSPFFDPAFNQGNPLNVPGNVGDAHDVAVQSDGKIVIAGKYHYGEHGLFTRLNADGTLDTTFAMSGWLTLGTEDSIVVESLALQPTTNKILFAGSIHEIDGSEDAFIGRLSDNGLDSFFPWRSLPAGTLTRAFDIVGLSDGRVLVGGYSPANGGDFAVMRFSAGGSLDTTFGVGGIATVDFSGGLDDGRAMAVAPDGKIVFAGAISTVEGTDLGVARLTSNGQLDTSFDGDGKRTAHVGVVKTEADSVLVQPDGKIVIAGMKSDSATSFQDSLIIRYNTNGAPDSTFGQSGIVTQNKGAAIERWEDVIRQSDGKLVATGEADSQMLVSRFNSNGTPDTSFGNGGTIFPATSALISTGFASTQQADGKIVSVGYSRATGPADDTFFVARFGPSNFTPSLALSVASDSGTSNNDRLTNDTTPTFIVPTLPSGIYFRVMRNGTTTGSQYASGTSFTAPVQPDGTWNFTVQAVDAAGNLTGASVPLVVTIDSTPPTAQIVAVSPDPRGTPVERMTIVFSETMTTHNVTGMTLTRNGGANLIGSSSLNLGTGDHKTYSITVVSLTVLGGTYVLTLKGGDASFADPAGNIMQSNAVETWVNTSSPNPAAIAGYLYNDVNASNTDEAEPRLTNWQVILDLNKNNLFDTGEPSTFTDSTGYYAFTGLATGTYRVKPIMPSGWKPKMPNDGWMDSTLSAGTIDYSRTFGFIAVPPPANASIAGVVYNDVNGNGVRDAGEPGISGRSVYLDLNNDNILEIGETNLKTDATGAYKFSNLGAVTYTVRQDLPFGWQQTVPANNAAWIVTLSANQNVTGKDFGTTNGDTSASGSIAGSVYNDSNVNGTKDAGEVGISGWQVFIDADKDGVLDSGEAVTTTDSSGAYKFSNLAAGGYRVRDVLPASGWRRTSPSSGYLDVTLASAQNIAGKNFGNTTFAKIAGTLFNDVSGDGTRQSATEPGLKNWQVYLDSNKNGALDAGEQTKLTDANGNYSFDTLAAGTYRVREVLPAGWTIKKPASGYYDVTLAAGTIGGGKDFGNYGTMRLSGVVFGDLDKNGVWALGDEDGAIGVRVYIDANNNGKYDTGETSILSDSAGNWGFASLADGTYIVRAVSARPEWGSLTSPASGFYSIILGAGQSVSGILFGVESTAATPTF